MCLYYFFFSSLHSLLFSLSFLRELFQNSTYWKKSNYQSAQLFKDVTLRTYIFITLSLYSFSHFLGGHYSFYSYSDFSLILSFMARLWPMISFDDEVFYVKKTFSFWSFIDYSLDSAFCTSVSRFQLTRYQLVQVNLLCATALSVVSDSSHFCNSAASMHGFARKCIFF